MLEEDTKVVRQHRGFCPGMNPREWEFQRTSALCVDAPYDRIRPESKVKNISVMTTLRRIGMVMYMTMFNVFGLGVIDLLCCCCCRASTETCYCQYIQDMLLWACMKFCCCTYNTYESPPYSIQESPCSRSIQVELGKVEGSWSTVNYYSKQSQVFEYWAVSSLATDTGENESPVPCDDDVIRSDWVRPIVLRHLEFHARNLYM